MVREYDEHIEYLDGIEFAENPVLYKFERKWIKKWQLYY
jgi:hypothetical protein